MFLKILSDYIMGYVHVVIEGYYIERFINICISKKIMLWNMRREKASILYANIGIKDFKRLKEIARKTGSKIAIQNKKGMPFLLNRYRKRKIFLFSLILIFLMLFLTSKFVWNIEVRGNVSIETGSIVQDLNECGLTTGKLKSKIDTKKMINDIRLKRDDIAWIGIHVDGTNVIVEIVEAEKRPEIIDEEDYCNIVSDKEGIITKISAQNGTVLVKQGDVVKKGDILVGGWMDGKYTGTRYVHSNADVQAKVWYSKKEKMILNQEVREKTGVEEKRYAIKFNNFKINLYKSLPKFKNYDTINENKKVKLFSNFYLPIEILTDTYYEVNFQPTSYTTQEAKQILIEKLETQLSEEVKETNNIVNKQVNVNEGDGYIEVEVIYEVLENIGTKEKLIN